LFGTKTSRATRATGGGDFCTLGQVILTAGKTSGPDTMPASGQLLSIASFTALFSLLGTDYGGNGSTTFRLPDLRNAAPNGLTCSICVTGMFP
jgi:microcystin-dependent protein